MPDTPEPTVRDDAAAVPEPRADGPQEGAGVPSPDPGARGAVPGGGPAAAAASDAEATTPEDDGTRADVGSGTDDEPDGVPVGEALTPDDDRSGPPDAGGGSTPAEVAADAAPTVAPDAGPEVVPEVAPLADADDASSMVGDTAGDGPRRATTSAGDAPDEPVPTLARPTLAVPTLAGPAPADPPQPPPADVAPVADPEPSATPAPSNASAPSVLAPPAAGAPPPSAPVPVPTGRPRVTRGQLLAGALCALLGFALVVQVQQTQTQGLDTLRQTELVSLLNDITESSARTDAETRRLQESRDRLLSGTEGAAAAEQAARQRLDVLGILAGTARAEGPGIELTVQDPQGKVDAATLLDTLQELRDAGAEAVQIGDVRVVASTAFVDAPDQGGVTVDGTTLRPPYRWRVIGDPQTLETALDIPGGVLEVLRQKGGSGAVRHTEGGQTIVVDALRDVRAPQYARPAPASSP